MREAPIYCLRRRAAVCVCMHVGLDVREQAFRTFKSLPLIICSPVLPPPNNGGAISTDSRVQSVGAAEAVSTASSFECTCPNHSRLSSTTSQGGNYPIEPLKARTQLLLRVLGRKCSKLSKHWRSIKLVGQLAEAVCALGQGVRKIGGMHRHTSTHSDSEPSRRGWFLLIDTMQSSAHFLPAALRVPGPLCSTAVVRQDITGATASVAGAAAWSCCL